ncbi:MAG: hypothetical protein HYR86_01615 [Candidatus Rokubacteria bacterium]|nr:hypothetical protein [Candidatus Rokubacteria bacterium]
MAKRDADMKGPRYLDTGTEANRYAVFEIKSVEIGGPLVAGQVSPARVRGLLVIKSKMVERTADARVRYIQLAGAQLEEQKRWGFTTDNLKITATFATMLSDHAIEVPRILFYKLSNEIQMEADLTFVR